MIDPELLTASELAERLSLRPSTIRRWATQGRIPEIYLSAKVRRFSYSAVVAAIENLNDAEDREGLTDGT